jgi:hypothetical protein
MRNGKLQVPLDNRFHEGYRIGQSERIFFQEFVGRE